MAQRSGFFTAQQNPDGSYDRVYTAEEFAFYFSKFIGNGVFITPATQLQVSQSSDIDMSVNVSAGDAYINGWWYDNTNVVNLRISAANGFNGRIDLVVLRWSKLTRDITLAIVEGEPAPLPIAPQLTRSEDVYELCLARVNVGATDTVISNAIIQDTRSDNSLCGFVHGVVDQIDATNLFQQFQANFDIWYNNLLQYSQTAETSFDEFMENSANEFREMLENDESRFSALLSTNQESFTTWFNNVKEQLSESVAGKLQLEIEELQRSVETYEDEWIAKEEGYKSHTFVKHNNKLWVSLKDTFQEPTDDSTEWLFLAVCKLTPITRSNVLTIEGQYAIDAIELNPNISNTLACKGNIATKTESALKHKLWIDDYNKNTTNSMFYIVENLWSELISDYNVSMNNTETVRLAVLNALEKDELQKAFLALPMMPDKEFNSFESLISDKDAMLAILMNKVVLDLIANSNVNTGLGSVLGTRFFDTDAFRTGAYAYNDNSVVVKNLKNICKAAFDYTSDDKKISDSRRAYYDFPVTYNGKYMLCRFGRSDGNTGYMPFSYQIDDGAKKMFDTGRHAAYVDVGEISKDKIWIGPEYGYGEDRYYIYFIKIENLLY